MTKVKMTKGKYNHLLACADANGVIAAAAADQRGSLQKSIAKAFTTMTGDKDHALGGI